MKNQMVPTGGQGKKRLKIMTKKLDGRKNKNNKIYDI